MSARGNGTETAIRGRLDELVRAIGAKDLDRLRTIYATDVVSFDVEPPLAHRGVSAKLENWQRAFAAFRDVRYEIRDLNVTVGSDIAFAHLLGRLGGTRADGTAVAGMWVRATICLRKSGGDWRITHDHASVPLEARGAIGAAGFEL